MNLNVLIENIKKIRIKNNDKLMRDLLCIRRINYTTLQHIIGDPFYLQSFTKEIIKKQLVSEFKLKECVKGTNMFFKASIRYELFKYLSSYENIKKVLKAIKKFSTMNMYYYQRQIYYPFTPLIHLESGINENGYLEEYCSIKYWIDYICPAIIMDPHIQYNSLIP